MTSNKTQLLYGNTIGAVVGSKPNLLWNITTTCSGASKFADIDLGLDYAVAMDKDAHTEIRAAVRSYFGEALVQGEGLRCWLGVRGNPRINIRLKRKSGQIGVEFENTEAISLIQHWCKMAGVTLH
jgi:hypothetical protein